ncbi:hypothetical protein [Mucilaginibacter aquatilis]|uniref:Uncharacterized protein n=1 Tax=Mucilaginibacter aquatilis TaxID=1517760 RepID=A0A6I4IDX2_9SPHI|nr:hypothetical protein [Mucilaginibacter aquatilis]MVN92018.1 hypothetical protein [Mucilaginibacter aquatilis]
MLHLPHVACAAKPGNTTGFLFLPHFVRSFPTLQQSLRGPTQLQRPSCAAPLSPRSWKVTGKFMR